MDSSWLPPQAWVGSFAWTFVWQTTLWLTVGLLLSRFLRRHAARAHLVLLLTTVAAVVSPLLTAAVGSLEWGVLPRSSSAVSATVGEQPTAWQLRSVASARVAKSRLASRVRSSEATHPATSFLPPDPPDSVWVDCVRDSLFGALQTAWILSSLILAVRVANSLLAGRRIVGQAIDVTNQRVLRALREAAEVLFIQPEPLLRTSVAARSPMIWCWGKEPVLLAPQSTIDDEGVAWPGVFCHELAHWQRCDHWAALWADVLVSVVPWHPLTWLARRQLTCLREQACDDWALAFGGAAVDYADSLLSLVPQGRPVYALSVLSSRELLRGRLEHILAGVEVVPHVGRRWIAGLMLFIVAAVTALAFAQESSASPEIPFGTRIDASPPAQRIAGRVVGPNGVNMGGARVYVGRFWDFTEEGSQLKATTDIDGQFDFDMPWDSLFGAFGTQIVAIKPGFGPGWFEIAPYQDSSDLTLRLVRDKLPEQRLVTNRNGQLGGGAAAQFFGHRDFANNGQHPLDDLTFPGDRIADPNVDVSTGSPQEVSERSKPRREAEPVYTAALLYHVRPSRPIVGTVTNFQTGRPVAGVRVVLIGEASQATSDATGRFKLLGAGETKQYRLFAVAPRGTSLLGGSLTAVAKSEGETLEVQLHVYPAIPLCGRVIDQSTGKPVAAEVAYWPLFPNHQIVTGMCGTAVNACGAFSQAAAQPDGSFELAALPGPGALVARIAGRKDFQPVVVDAAAFFAKAGVAYGPPGAKGKWKDVLAVSAAKTTVVVMPQSTFQGISLLNVAPDAKHLTQDIRVTSKPRGKTAQ